MANTNIKTNNSNKFTLPYSGYPTWKKEADARRTQQRFNRAADRQIEVAYNMQSGGVTFESRRRATNGLDY